MFEVGYSVACSNIIWQDETELSSTCIALWYNNCVGYICVKRKLLEKISNTERDSNILVHKLSLYISCSLQYSLVRPLLSKFNIVRIDFLILSGICTKCTLGMD